MHESESNNHIAVSSPNSLGTTGGNREYATVLTADDFESLINPDEDFNLKDILKRIRSIYTAAGVVRAHTEDSRSKQLDLLARLVDRVTDPKKLEELEDRIENLKISVEQLLAENDTYVQNPYIELAGDEKLTETRAYLNDVLEQIADIKSAIAAKKINQPV